MADMFQRRDIVVVRIGKKGLYDSVINEIKNVLKKHGIVKIKFLKSFRENICDRKEVAELLAKKVEAKIIGIRGYNVILKSMRKA